MMYPAHINRYKLQQSCRDMCQSFPVHEPYGYKSKQYTILTSSCSNWCTHIALDRFTICIQYISLVFQNGHIKCEPGCVGCMQIKSESKKVWKFIIDREIEAPARFQAIQSYRYLHSLQASHTYTYTHSHTRMHARTHTHVFPSHTIIQKAVHACRLLCCNTGCMAKALHREGPYFLNFLYVFGHFKALQ